MMTKEKAMAEWLALVAQYGLQWTAAVPADAYKRLEEVSKLLTPDEKRAALFTRSDNP